MNLRLHIERLIVDEGALTRGDRDGLAQAIERDLRTRLGGPSPAADGRDTPPTPAHVAAISDGILEHLPSPAGPRPAGNGGPR